MKYEIDKEEKYYLLKPKVDKIDSTLSPALKADFITFEIEGAKNMIVNLENVKYIDSSGLSALLVGNRIFSEKKGSFVICNLNEHVMKLMKIAKLDKVLSLLPSVQESIDSIFLDEIEKNLE
tara:strand:- start:214 stop:579 length:366 start_codon:yes stop_codon:yes gene_type:complete